MTDKPRVAWISTVDQADATGDVADAYAVCDAKKTGQVDHIMKVHSLHPRSMLDHEQLYRTLMYGPSPLKRPQREMIATVVSALNHCVYWLKHHARNLRQLTRDTELVEQLSNDYTAAPLNAADRAMLDYTAKLTLTPTAVTEADIPALRAVGFDDRAILDIVQITAYYAYVNRIADGLGVTLEIYWQRGDDPGA